MALYDLRPMWSGQNCETQSDGKSGSRSSTRAWTGLSSDPANDTPEIILAQSGIAIGQGLASDPFRRIRSVRCQRIAPILFKIEASLVAENAEDGENPLDEPPVIEYDFADAEEAIDVDYNGDPIVTKNGEGYDPPITDDISDLVITVQRNVATFDPLLAWEYKGATNSDTFVGFPPGVCKLIGIRSGSVTADDFIYFKSTAVVQVRRIAPGSTAAKAWWKRIRHEGYLEKLANGDIKHARELLADGKRGEKVVKPVQLKLDGTRETDPTVAHWIEYQTKPSLPFSGMGIL